MTQQPTPPTFRCSSCQVPKPRHEFRYRRNGQQQHRECNSCHNRKERIRKAGKKSRDLAALVQKLNIEKDDAAAKALARELCRRFGGADKVTQLWHNQVERGLQHRLGANMAATGLAALGRLAAACE